MEKILGHIRKLRDDQAMEAAGLLASEDVEPGTPEAMIERVAAGAVQLDAESLREALLQATPTQVAELSRALLTFAALEGRQDDVRLAIEGTGKTLLLLEVFVIGGLALAAYQLWKTDGRKKVTKSTTVTVDVKAGVLEVRCDVTTEYFSVGETLGHAVKAAIGE